MATYCRLAIGVRPQTARRTSSDRKVDPRGSPWFNDVLYPRAVRRTTWRSRCQLLRRPIVASGITEVYIGVLDPNGTIYSQGFRKLLESNISVKFFSRKLRAALEEDTFEFGEVHAVYGSGKRRVPVVHSGIEINVHFSKTDLRKIPINWASLQTRHGCVDLSSGNGAVMVASGASAFRDITDPTVSGFPVTLPECAKE